MNRFYFNSMLFNEFNFNTQLSCWKRLSNKKSSIFFQIVFKLFQIYSQNISSTWDRTSSTFLLLSNHLIIKIHLQLRKSGLVQFLREIFNLTFSKRHFNWLSFNKMFVNSKIFLVCFDKIYLLIQRQSSRTFTKLFARKSKNCKQCWWRSQVFSCSCIWIHQLRILCVVASSSAWTESSFS